MKFSLYYLPAFHKKNHVDVSTLYRQIFDEVALAEEIGMDRVWFAEHHFSEYGGDVPSVPMMLTALAQRTKRIRVAAGGCAVPLHRPVELAEHLAMTDVLSGGRLDIGVVHAFLHYEFAAYNIDMGESRERFKEGVEIIRGLFANDEFSYDGKYSKLDRVSLRPRPIQRRPRLTLGTIITKDSFVYAGHNGMDLMLVPYLMPPEELAKRIVWYKDALKEAGHDPRDFNIMAQFFFYAHPDRQQAYDFAKGPMLTYLGYIRDAVSGDKWSKDYPGYKGMAQQVEALMDFDMLFKDRTLFGDPDHLRARLDTLVDLGITEASLMVNMPGMDHKAAMQSMRYFAKEIMPAYQGKAVAAA